jgi:hypothetical protein
LTIQYCQHVCPVVLVSAMVKLVPALIAETEAALVIAGATHVGLDGRSPAKVIGMSKMRECAVTAVVLIV